MTARLKRMLGAVTLLASSTAFAQAAHAETETISGFSSWVAQGQTSQTGPGEATFVGELTGRVYVETEKGPVSSGTMRCPTVIKIAIESGAQSGEGRCTITAKDGASLYADIKCTGVHMVGCDGTMTLSGGSARFERIKGSGAVTIRGDYREIKPILELPATESATGIMYFFKLAYSMQ